MKKTITFQADNLNYDLNGKTLIENVSLYVERGELLYICGTFYSGINALSDIMMGRTEPASGRFYFCGTPVKSALSALPIGRIGIQSMLIDQMTIAENLCLIRSGAPRIVKRVQIEAYTETLLSIYHIPLSADTRISDLSAIEKRVIEILKLVLAGCPLIIIDSTVCYTDNGNRLLCEFINTFRKHGISFIVFGNKPTWFFKEADRTMIFRKNHVASYIMKDGRHYTGEEVIRMMSVIFREKNEDESLPDIEEKRDILEISTNNAAFSDIVRIREGEAACFLTLDLQFAEKLAKAFGMLSYRSRRKHTVQIFDTEWTVRRVKGCSVSLLSFNDIENMICGDISIYDNAYLSLLQPRRGPHRRVLKNAGKFFSRQLERSMQREEDWSLRENGDTLTFQEKQKLLTYRSLIGKSKLLVMFYPPEISDRILMSCKSAGVTTVIITDTLMEEVQAFDQIFIIEQGYLKK